MTPSRPWIPLLALTLLGPAPLTAQSHGLPAPLTPMDELSWGDGTERLDRVITDLGFRLREDASNEHGRLYMGAMVLEHSASMIAMMAAGGVAQLSVQLHRRLPITVDEPARELLATYRRLARRLTARFGAPDAAVEAYGDRLALRRPPLDGAVDDTMAAIEEGRALLLRAWQRDSMVVGLEMNGGGREPSILVIYERPSGYGTETVLERARQAPGAW